MSLKSDNFHGLLHLYAPKEIMDSIDWGKEVKELNKEQRIFRTVRVDTLKTNFILMLNFLSHTINDCHNPCVGISREKLSKACSSKYYRIVIDILKKHKYLYVLTVDDKETYCVKVFSKSYRWNKSKNQFNTMVDIYKHPVRDTRVINKVLDNIELYQCFKYIKPNLNKTDKNVSVVKRPKGFNKGGRGIRGMLRDMNYIIKTKRRDIYVTPPSFSVKSNRVKYGIQLKLCKNYGIVLRNTYYIKYTSEYIKKLYDKIVSAFDIGTNIYNNIAEGHSFWSFFRTCRSSHMMFYN